MPECRARLELSVVECVRDDGHAGPHRDFYGEEWSRVSAASSRSDGETIDVGPVTVGPAIPRVSGEDTDTADSGTTPGYVYRVAAERFHTLREGYEHSELIGPLAADLRFRAAIDAAIDAAYPDPDALLGDLDQARAELAQVTAERDGWSDMAAKAAEHDAEMRRELAQVTRERDEARLAHQTAITALAKFVDDEPCRLDHNGACQEHMVDVPCSVAWARKLIKEANRG